MTGAERTTVWATVQEAAQRMEIAIKPDAHPEQGHFYRSDHFSLAHAGVPAFSIGLGTDYDGKPPAMAKRFSKNTTKSTIISRPTNITTIGISAGWRRWPSSPS